MNSLLIQQLNSFEVISTVTYFICFLLFDNFKMFRSPKAKTHLESDTTTLVKSIFAKVAKLQEQLCEQRSERRKNDDELLKKIAYLQQTKKSKVPIKYSKLTQKKFYSPVRQHRNVRQNLSCMKEKQIQKNLQIKQLKEQIVSINENVNKIITENEAKLINLIDRNTSQVFKKIHEIQTMSIQNFHDVNNLDKKLCETNAINKQLYLQIGNTLSKQLDIKIGILEQQIQTSKSHLLNSENIIHQILSSTQNTVLRSHQSITILKSCLQNSLLKQKPQNNRQTQIQTNSSIHFQSQVFQGQRQQTGIFEKKQATLYTKKQ